MTNTHLKALLTSFHNQGRDDFAAMADEVEQSLGQPPRMMFSAASWVSLFVILGSLLVVSFVVGLAMPAQGNPPIEVNAPAPTFTDPTCENNTRPQHDKPEVEGLVYYSDTDAELPGLRLIITVEAKEGYEIVGYGAGGDDGLYTNPENRDFEGWFHDYPPFKTDCGDQLPVGKLPDTGR